jgi:AraC-like DNA-binding protein
MRKMTDHTIRQAATRYQTGESLTSVAADFGVSARTLAREFKQAGVQIRQRRGWLTAL